MTANATGKILHYIRDLAESEATKVLSDAQLVTLFTQQRQEAAFAGMVKRHGRLVWGVCRHLLGKDQDAEDAFQATFLVLARRPGSIRKAEALGSWLHGVAYRVAREAMKKRRKRQTRERRAAAVSTVTETAPQADLAWGELQGLLDEEVARLPEKYRAPFVLCCLEGRTREEVSKDLHWNEGTVSSRIARARQLLQARLTRRGAMLSAALCASDLWSNTAKASLSKTLAANTIKAACGATEGKAFEGASAGAVALAEGVMRAMTLAKWQVGAVLLVAFGFVAVGADQWSRHAPMAPAPHAQAAQDPAPATPAKKDLYGDPLPEGVIARLGTLRQRTPASRLAVTADGKEVIAVNDELTVRRFDALTGRLLATRELPRDQSGWTWLSPRGTFVVALKPIHGELELWDLSLNKTVKTLPLEKEGRPNGMRGVEFSLDERLAALWVTDDDGHQIIVWDLKTLRSEVLWSEKRKNAGGPLPQLSLALSPDGMRLAAVSADETLRCWEIQGGKLLWQSTASVGSTILFSPDGRTVVAAPEGKAAALRRWQARTGAPIELKNQPPKGAVQLICFVPGRPYLALETELQEVVLWDPDTAKVALLLRLPRSLAYGIRSSLANYTYVFTPDGTGLINRAGALQRWDLTTGKAVYADTEAWGHTAAVLKVLFSPDGTLLASSSVDQTARVWNVASARPLHVFPKDKTHHLAFSPDGQHFFVRPPGDDKVVVRRYGLATGRAEQDYELPDNPGPHPYFFSEELQVASGGDKILMTNVRFDKGYQTWLTTWDTHSAKCLKHGQMPWGSVLTPGGESVVAFGPDATVKLLDIATGKPRWRFTTAGDDKFIRPEGCDLVVSPSGRLLAARAYVHGDTALIDDDIRIGDMRTGRQIASVPIPRPVANERTSGEELAFAPDDRLFAVIATTGVRLFETASWQEIGAFNATDPSIGRIYSLAIAPDGRTLATGHVNSTILIWDATLRAGTRGGKLSVTQAESLWTALAGTDAPQAYAAIWKLVDDPQRAITLLRERLKLAEAARPDLTKPMLDDLDSDQFKVREEARQRLQALGELAEPALRSALKANPSLEKRRRLEALLEQLNPSRPLKGEPLRGVRAVQILERIGTPEARGMLERLDQGLASASLTRAAKESLARIAKR